MVFNVVLPNLGFGMAEGRVITWLKKPGDVVNKGEAIAEIESDKATVELESVAGGVLEEILVQEGDVVPVDTVLARIRAGQAAPVATSTAPTASSGSGITPVAQRMAREHGIDLGAVTGTGPGGRITREDVQTLVEQRGQRPSEAAPGAANGMRPLAAPAVRKLARDNGIDLRSVRGTGTEGRITRADVEAILHGAPAASVLPPALASQRLDEGGGIETPLSNLRAAIARNLARSMQEAPHFYVTAELDLTAAIAKLTASVGINALILYLTVQTLLDVPELNATFANGKLIRYDHVNLAIAVAVDNGLISPVLHRADDFSVTGLAERARSLIERTRAGKLRSEELGGGTFTVSNLGMIRQVDHFTAVINPPQVGILAVGAAKDRPVAIDGGLYIRKTVHLTLSCDHRIVDGLIAGRFLEAFDKRLAAF